MTLVELLVVTVLLALVVGITTSVLLSMTRNERRQQAMITNEQDVELAVAAVARDIRNADPLLPLDDPASFASTLELATAGPEGAPRTVRWAVREGRLERSVLDAGGATVTSAVVLAGVVTPAPFTYLDATGVPIGGPGATVDDHVECTVRVAIALEAAPDAVGATASRAVEAGIRNPSDTAAACVEQP